MHKVFYVVVRQVNSTRTLRLTIKLCWLQEKGYVTADIAEEQGLHQLKLSGTKFRKMLRAGEDIPEW